MSDQTDPVPSPRPVTKGLFDDSAPGDRATTATTATATAPPVAPVPTPPARPAPAATTRTPSVTTALAGDEPDWTDQVADLIVDAVDKVRDRTTGVVLSASRALVYGIAAAIVALVVATIGLLLVSRLLGIIPGQIWIPYVAIGAILVLAGTVCWTKRKPRP